MDPPLLHNNREEIDVEQVLVRYPLLSREETFITNVRSIILANIYDENFKSTDLARGVALSVSQLNRRLKAISKSPAGQLIRQFRMERAASLLAKDAAPVSEISKKVGFSSQANFCRSFKQYFGCTPGSYKNRK